MLSVPGAARSTIRHKVTSAVVAVLIAVVIAVSVISGAGGTVSYPAAPAFTLPALGEPGRLVAALPQTFFLNARHQVVAHSVGVVTSAQPAADLSLMTAQATG
jgi:hypothetical protein